MTTALRMTQASLFDVWQAPPRRRMIVQCARELRRLAAKRKEYGVTAFDTLHIAKRFGYATGAETNQRALSWFAAVPRTARLRATDRTRLSPKRNAQRVYVL